VNQGIHDALMQGPEAQIEFFHGYTYSGHPVACAASMATLDIYEQEGLLTRGAELASDWTNAIHGLAGLPHVIDIRAIGLAAGIELEPRLDAPGARAYELFVDCFEQGVLIRAAGDIVVLSPPLIVTPEHIDQIVTTLADGLRRIV
jgi:beta-alanine--pyruvate transaminase